MKLHANAPLGPKGRATMVRRVIEEGIALTEAAEAAGVSERTAGKWVRRYRAEGEAGLLDRSSAPQARPQRHPGRAGRGDRRPAASADDRPRDRRDPGDGDLDGLGGAEADRSGQALPPGAPGADPPLRASRPGELIHIDVKKLGRIGPQGAGHRVLGRNWAKKAGHAPTQRGRRRRPAGSGSTSASTTPPAWPTSRSCPTRRRPPRSASCGGPSPSTAPTGSRWSG